MHIHVSGLLTSKHSNPTIIHKCHWAFSTQIPQALKINNQLPFIDVNEVSQLSTFKHTKASNEQQTYNLSSIFNCYPQAIGITSIENEQLFTIHRFGGGVSQVSTSKHAKTINRKQT
jgi:hypothetical protein